MIAHGSHLRILPDCPSTGAVTLAGNSLGCSARGPEAGDAVWVLLVIRKPLYFTHHPLAITLPVAEALNRLKTGLYLLKW